MNKDLPQREINKQHKPDFLNSRLLTITASAIGLLAVVVGIFGKPLRLVAAAVLGLIWLWCIYLLISRKPRSPRRPLIIVGATMLPFMIAILILFQQVFCPCYDASDFMTFTRLVQAEANSVNNADFPGIERIFSPGAAIRDIANQKTWNSPAERYRDDLFKNTTFRNAQHADYRLVGDTTSETTAWMTSSSSGEYRINNGAWNVYNNPPGSDHWIFTRNGWGCWQISLYEFNARESAFP